MNERDLFAEALAGPTQRNGPRSSIRCAPGTRSFAVDWKNHWPTAPRGSGPLDRPPIAPADLPTPLETGEYRFEGGTKPIARTDPGATSARESGVAAPTGTATGEHRPEAATETLARPDPDATSAPEPASTAPHSAGLPSG